MTRATGALYPGLTIRDVLATVLVVGSIFGAIILAYQLGRIDERHDRDAIACTPNVDSIVVAPRYVPRGPVR